MIKNLIIVIFMLVVFNGLFIFSGGLDALMQHEPPVETTTVEATIVDAFKFTLDEEVVKKLGQPIEGFEPHMYLSVFPGLVATDFDGVQASIGQYQMQDGKLEHDLGSTELVHSAAGAITREGMETLLQNVAARADIDLATTGTLTDVINIIAR